MFRLGGAFISSKEYIETIVFELVGVVDLVGLNVGQGVGYSIGL